MGKAITMSDIPDASQRDPLRTFVNEQGRLRNNKKLQEIMPSGLWRGRRCFVIGGGTSLKGFDFEQLRGELVITVNRAFEACPFSALNVAQDARVWGWYENGDLGQIAKDKFQSYKGLKVWLNVQVFPFPEDIYTVDIVHPDDFSWERLNYAGGIPPYGNSGLNAIFLALCLGANPIYLLGFDLYGVNGHTANFHEGYLDNNDENVYKNNFLPDFKDCAGKIKNKGIRIINLNPKSELKEFEFGDFDKIPKIKRPVIVSFYTQEYEKAAKAMEISAIKFGFETDIVKIEKKGTWLKTMYYRADFIKEMLNKHKRPIVWLDSDALILKYPELFDDLKVDFAVHILNTKKLYPGGYPRDTELLGGTMFFNYTPKALKLVKNWIEANKKNPDVHLSQWVLQDILKEWDGKMLELPPNYTQIFDSMAHFGEPVIEHYMYSRRFRNA